MDMHIRCCIKHEHDINFLLRTKAKLEHDVFLSLLVENKVANLNKYNLN